MAVCLEKLSPFLGKDSVQVSHGKPLQHRSDEQIVENRCAKAAAPDRRDKAGIRRTSRVERWRWWGQQVPLCPRHPGMVPSSSHAIHSHQGRGSTWCVMSCLSGETQILEHVRCSTVSQLVPWVFRRQSHSL